MSKQPNAHIICKSVRTANLPNTNIKLVKRNQAVTVEERREKVTDNLLLEGILLLLKVTPLCGTMACRKTKSISKEIHTEPVQNFQAAPVANKLLPSPTSPCPSVALALSYPHLPAVSLIRINVPELMVKHTNLPPFPTLE